MNVMANMSNSPDGKFNQKFFLETTNMNEPKLYINAHWMVPYKGDIVMLI